MSRLEVIAPGYRLHRTGPDCWRVTSPSGGRYVVQPEAGRCSCPDFAARGRRRACKHIRAIRALIRLCPGLDAG